MDSLRYFLLAFMIVVIDQTSKMLVFNNMHLHEEINVIGEWFRIHYLLNPGMAFGIKWENEFGKLALTIFRIGAMFGISWYLWKMAERNMHSGFLWCMGLILGGAVGNVIDSTFYGVLLNNAPADAPTPWFHGQVIDMLYFPIFDFVWPEWVPFVGGRYFEFFSPVFNIADSSIFLGVVTILIMQKRFFKEKHHEQPIENITIDQPVEKASEESSSI
ncbi:MAG: lipoprotein signal peptidase [Cyclobacteriaceae bacterium]|nr:lipoprotein signal peptidase [Cyclobacteriaceae bacterium]UYN86674.1 MAG: lipoprotein signal peptidase [Cyclobacteriaceae bacterium]